jgi:hypothetical protein
MPDAMNIREVAQFAGLGEAQIRQWGIRYGWPQPARDRRGNRVFNERQAITLRSIAALLRTGVPISTIIVDGLPRVAAPAARTDTFALDLTALPRPQTKAGEEVQRLLILGLVQRHPGRIRCALAQCARLRPDERGPAALLVLDAARAQNPSHAAWIDQAVEG